MPAITIRSLAHELADQLTRERPGDPPTVFELGRLTQVLTMLQGAPPARDPAMRTRASDLVDARPVTYRERTAEFAPAAPAAPLRGARGEFAPRPGGPRKRVEKRKMRNPVRTFTAPDGHVVVYDFTTLQVKDSPAKGPARTETLGSRKEMWERLKKTRKEFRAARNGK